MEQCNPLSEFNAPIIGKSDKIDGPTPRNAKLQAVTASITDLRPHIAREMAHELLRCPLNSFLNHYCPFNPDPQCVDAVLKKLQSGGVLRTFEHKKTHEQRLLWTRFKNAPSDAGPHEEITFRPLEAIVNAIRDVSCDIMDRQGRQPQFCYRDCPRTGMKSAIPGCNFKVDACLTSSRAGQMTDHGEPPINSSDAAVIAEFKKSEKSVKDNRVKLVSAANSVMNDDPSRMWMYGITIEDTKMALWYFSRSHSVKSADFEWTKDVKTVVRIFLSLLYATREEIGYDPTVHRVRYEGEPQYVYELHTPERRKYFRTIEPLYNPRVLNITGRKTRVYKAIEVSGYHGEALKAVEGTKEVVVKDIWLDEKSKTERTIMDAIFERLKTVKEENYNWAPAYLKSRLNEALLDEGYKNYFMEIECDCLLTKSKEPSKEAKPAPQLLSLSPLEISEILDDEDSSIGEEDEKMLAMEDGSSEWEEIESEDGGSDSSREESSESEHKGTGEREHENEKGSRRSEKGSTETKNEGLDNLDECSESDGEDGIDEGRGTKSEGKERSRDERKNVLYDPNMIEDAPPFTGFPPNIPRDNTTMSLSAPKRSYRCKQQYRVVYKDVGQSLENAEDLEISFLALLDSFVALVLLYLAGWVHRDVTVTNIIVVPRQGGRFGGKLSDLEYAKEFADDSGSPDPKTGAPYFLPLEIHSGRRLSKTPQREAEETLPDFDLFEEPEIPSQLESDLDLITEDSSPIKFQFQHDLESLWWIALWILIYRVDFDKGLELSRKLFAFTVVPNPPRLEFFEQGNSITRYLRDNQCLHPKLRDNKIILTAMRNIQSRLYNSYLMENPLDEETLHDIYTAVWKAVLNLAAEMKKVGKIYLREHVVIKPKETNKRKGTKKDLDDGPYEEEGSKKRQKADNYVGGVAPRMYVLRSR